MTKNILLCVSLYIMLLAMVIALFLMPGSLQRDQAPFFRDFSTFMIMLGSLWMIKSTIFVLLAPWYTYIWTKRKHRFVQRNYRPLVSVIIPAWNEEVGLVATIKTILASTYRPLEIVVVNDGSTDRSDEIAREFIQKYQLHIEGSDDYTPIIYHYQANGGKGSALNTGVSLSHGEIILTFDADSIIHEDAVGHFVSYFADPSVMAAAGNIRIGNIRTTLGLVQSLEYYFGFQNKKAESLLGIIFVIGGAASAFRKEVFHKLGGYHTGTLTEDLDLSLRIQKAGMRIIYAPEAIVHTEGPTTLRGLLKQRLRWKRGRLEAFGMHRASFFSRNKDGNTFFFWIILPLVIMGDIETGLGTIYTILLYFYSFLTHDFSFLLLTISFSAVLFSVQLCEDRYFRNFRYLLLGPLVWFFLHFAAFVELYALMQALYVYYRKREVKWQTWKRTGVVDS